MILDLSDNPISDLALDALIELLDKNKRIVRIEMKGTKIRRENAVRKLGKHASRVVV